MAEATRGKRPASPSRSAGKSRAAGSARSAGKARAGGSARASGKPRASDTARAAGKTRASGKARAAGKPRASGKARASNASSRARTRTASTEHHEGARAHRAASKAHEAPAKRTTRSRGLTAKDAVRAALANIPELLGRPVEGVLGVERDQRHWVVRAQVVELERIPNTTDVLGEYEAVLDDRGEILGCRRTRVYGRAQASEGQS